MHFSRVDRLQSQLVKEIASIFTDELKDKPPAMITFTRAEITRDLKFAKVFFSTLGKEKQVQASLRFLERHAGIIRKMLGRRMRIRHTPEVTFRYDASTDNVMRIHQILERIKKNEGNS